MQKSQLVGDFKSYITSLSTLDGKPLLMCRRRTFAVGFLTTANSALSLASTLFTQHGNPFQYFLTFKLSQDPIETLFSKIRSMGGFNNNPNVVQFGSALKKLLVKQSINPSKNANSLDFGSQSSIFALKWSKRTSPVADMVVDELVGAESEFVDQTLTVAQNNIVYYIGGFVVRGMLGQIKCVECSALVVASGEVHPNDHGYVRCADDHLRLLAVKDRGGLVKASEAVYSILNLAEKYFRTILPTSTTLPPRNHARLRLVVGFLRLITDGQSRRFFPTVEHSESVMLGEMSHEDQLTRQLVTKYYDIRLSHHTKLYNRSTFKNEASSRSLLNRLTLFRHQ